MPPGVESLPELETVACYVCGARESSPWAEENGFLAVRCRMCGLIYVNPRPTRGSISRAAQSGLHAGSATVDETGARDAGKVKLYQRRLRALFEAGALAKRPGARWLDIGCGFGEFLEALKLESAGRLSTIGSEPNERKAAAARGRGLDVTFRELSTEPPGYAFVSLLNVFSHLPDPLEFLGQLAGLLEPGGQLVLQTGNWAELDTPASAGSSTSARPFELCLGRAGEARARRGRVLGHFGVALSDVPPEFSHALARLWPGQAHRRRL
jgi:SAM-dependent methyltransferase